jgi:TolB protein
MKKVIFLLFLIFVSGCSSKLLVPKENNFGIYSLDLNSNTVKLFYSNNNSITSLSVNNKKSFFAFSMNDEIFIFDFVNNVLVQLTNNSVLDVYPVWSLDDSVIAYLSFNNTLDIRKMNINNSDNFLFYDSGFHDADIDWVDNKIVFTRNSQIWIMNDNGSNVTQLTNFSRAGEWGMANLHFGDYDPRISPDKSRIVFERLEDDYSIHGNYNLYLMNNDGSNLIKLTNNSFSQGLAEWSFDNEKIIYAVAAINDTGVFDIYLMNNDGSDNKNITPDYFPNNFLCHTPLFGDKNIIYFIGQWWE